VWFIKGKFNLIVKSVDDITATNRKKSEHFFNPHDKPHPVVSSVGISTEAAKYCSAYAAAYISHSITKTKK
jgi:hypothetical protein